MRLYQSRIFLQLTIDSLSSISFALVSAVPGRMLVHRWHIGCFCAREIYQFGCDCARCAARSTKLGRNTVLPPEHATDLRRSMPKWRSRIEISLKREDLTHMGANSKQGWYLFLFIIGFTFLVAGLAYLGPLFTLAGLACLIGSLVGFYRIKPLEHATGPSFSGASRRVRPNPPESARFTLNRFSEYQRESQ